MHTWVSISFRLRPLLVLKLFFDSSNKVMKYTCITMKGLSNLKYTLT